MFMTAILNVLPRGTHSVVVREPESIHGPAYDRYWVAVTGLDEAQPVGPQIHDIMPEIAPDNGGFRVSPMGLVERIRVAKLARSFEKHAEHLRGLRDRGEEARGLTRAEAWLPRQIGHLTVQPFKYQLAGSKDFYRD